MPTLRRWSLVLVGVVVLGLLPWAVAHRPVPSNGMSAATLLQRIQGSGGATYSGYAESDGGLQLPVSSQFNSIADLLGGTSQLRVWWRGAEDWRVDTISAFGESDEHRMVGGTWTWDYEALRATYTAIALDPSVRLPEAGDLLPSLLAQRLLSEAVPSEVSRLPVARIAGVDAPGLRLRPDQPASSVDHVDVWADPSTGVALRVEAFAAGAGTAAMSTSFLDFHAGTPAPATTAFAPPLGSHVETGRGFDLASGVDRFADVTPPAELAGLQRSTRTSDLGSIGVYGRGVTELIAAPLPNRFADPLRAQLARPATVPADGTTYFASAPPVNLLLAPSRDGRSSWLLTGTVTMATLQTAAAQLAADPPERR